MGRYLISSRMTLGLANKLSRVKRKVSYPYQLYEINESNITKSDLGLT